MSEQTLVNVAHILMNYAREHGELVQARTTQFYRYGPSHGDPSFLLFDKNASDGPDITGAHPETGQHFVVSVLSPEHAEIKFGHADDVYARYKSLPDHYQTLDPGLIPAPSRVAPLKEDAPPQRKTPAGKPRIKNSFDTHSKSRSGICAEFPPDKVSAVQTMFIDVVARVKEIGVEKTDEKIGITHYTVQHPDYKNGLLMVRLDEHKNHYALTMHSPRKQDLYVFTSDNKNASPRIQINKDRERKSVLLQALLTRLDKYQDALGLTQTHNESVPELTVLPAPA